MLGNVFDAAKLLDLSFTPACGKACVLAVGVAVDSLAWNRFSVDEQLVVFKLDPVAGDPDYALDECLAVIVAFDREVKHNDFARFRRVARNHVNMCERDSKAENVLVDEQVIADSKCRDHRAGRDLERLESKGSDQKGYENRKTH